MKDRLACPPVTVSTEKDVETNDVALTIKFGKWPLWDRIRYKPSRHAISVPANKIEKWFADRRAQ